jgi:hypothetical protein
MSVVPGEPWSVKKFSRGWAEEPPPDATAPERKERADGETEPGAEEEGD